MASSSNSWAALHQGYVSSVSAGPVPRYSSADLNVDEIEALPLPPGTERVVDTAGILLGYRDCAAVNHAGRTARVSAGGDGAQSHNARRSDTSDGENASNGTAPTLSQQPVLQSEHPLLRLAREDAERRALPRGWQKHTAVLSNGTCQPFYTRHARGAVVGSGSTGGIAPADGAGGPSAVKGSAAASHAENDYLGALHGGLLGAFGDVGSGAVDGIDGSRSSAGQPLLHTTWQHPHLRTCLHALTERLTWGECIATDEELRCSIEERNKQRRAATHRRNAGSRKRQLARDVEREAAAIQAMLDGVHSKLGITPIHTTQRQGEGSD